MTDASAARRWIPLATLAFWALAGPSAIAAQPPATAVGPPSELGTQGMRLSLVAISVRDMERSLRFYEALGFQVSNPRPIRAATAKVLEVKGRFEAKLAFINRDGVYIELIEMTWPKARPASQGAASQLGLSHLALRVDDVDRAAALVRANGGAVYEATRLADPDRDIMFCADPDGTRIELVRASAHGASLISAPARDPVR